MTPDELGRLKLEALRTLAVEHGIDGATQLGRAQLIEQLAIATEPKRPSLVERAKEAVAHAVEVVEEKAHELVEKVRHPRQSETPDEPATTVPATGAATATQGMGVPSSTVHPHFAQQPPQPQPAGEPLGMLDFEELPELYGVDECEVLFKDPHNVFAYWEVTDHGLEGARAQLGQSAGGARLVMRLFTTVPASGHVERETRDVELSWNHGRRYLQAPRTGAHLRIAVGLLSSEGYFAPIAHSSLIRVPPAEPQPGPVEWMEVVPARRGRTREPLVVVRRGGDHDERGVRTHGGGNGSNSGNGGGAGGSSPGASSWAGSSSSPTGGRRGGDSGGR